MATVEQVFALLEKGFTREEILRMTGFEKQQDPEPTQEPEPSQEPEPTQEPENAAAPDPEPSETDKRLDSIENSIKNLMKSIQQQNLKNDSFGKMADSIDEQTDRIMAGIIRPERKERTKHDE